MSSAKASRHRSGTRGTPHRSVEPKPTTAGVVVFAARWGIERASALFDFVALPQRLPQLQFFDFIDKKDVAAAIDVRLVHVSADGTPKS